LETIKQAALAVDPDVLVEFVCYYDSVVHGVVEWRSARIGGSWEGVEQSGVLEAETGLKNIMPQLLRALEALASSPDLYAYYAEQIERAVEGELRPFFIVTRYVQAFVDLEKAMKKSKLE